MYFRYESWETCRYVGTLSYLPVPTIFSNVCETSWADRRRYVHGNLFPVLYAGCPRLEYVNKYRFPAQRDTSGARLSLAQWKSLIRKTLLKKAKTC
jgi:hypothetical protein